MRGDKQNRRGSDSKPIEKEHKRRMTRTSDKKREDENVDWGEFKTHIYINNNPDFGG